MKIKNIIIIVAAVFVIGMGIALKPFTTIPAGHVGVGNVFGSVQQKTYTEGFNWVAPWVDVVAFDAREKTLKVTLDVPSQDQLSTTFDISIQYRLIKEMAPTMLSETGSPQEVIDVHMIPLMHSTTREIGKSVTKAEDFFEQSVQKRMQIEMLAALSPLASKGIAIEKLLIRKVTLPNLITKAVEKKKEVAQAAEKAIEELKKFKIDQNRKEAESLAKKKAEIIDAEKKAEVALTIANGNLQAAIIDAKATIVSAEADARAKRAVIDVIGADAYVKLKTAEVLPKLANGNHIIMMDPKGNMLPFMDINKFK